MTLAMKCPRKSPGLPSHEIQEWEVEIRMPGLGHLDSLI